MANEQDRSRATCPTDKDGRRDPASCDGGCPGCAGGAEPPADGLAGLRFVVPAMVAFLLPLAAAVIGSLIGGPGHGRVAGAIAGLAAGLLAAILLGRVVLPRTTNDAANPYKVDTSESIEPHGDGDYNTHKRQADL
ncbi:MAG: hypothetical protein GVY16_06150 [Planctomycetes bacterium]|jgi:hypothetical protein|nr:hypothetical protein [Phycisphaerae bacterium]NBB95305.1 hypothetical protein [Planctomycetota bacterium]